MGIEDSCRAAAASKFCGFGIILIHLHWHSNDIECDIKTIMFCTGVGWDTIGIST
jgi:hypothetical protein